ncbi:hypothetical protein F4V57_06795 [Acinetobacter qingfengensis]|uniref:Uncharacterized protein n=1 Tax=Acinetobacter qingfengensis TaxID=1262585 RepID=A0A1E7R396_9GAMM|nr:hypothetical protein [Acinetobacter qingfengensis]KAA8733755.1 hypothetical protein F4V57_06795 [Acinetobacter qingfengensis]OEY93733.1 hypothetical protein BJI46_04635 [Acinetobacter qingfengensis]
MKNNGQLSYHYYQQLRHKTSLSEENVSSSASIYAPITSVNDHAIILSNGLQQLKIDKMSFNDHGQTKIIIEGQTLIKQN